MEPLLNYALDGNGVLVHIDNVPKGKACGCFCPSCGKPLYARRGVVRAHHFSHAYDHNCKGAYETVLHLLAKEILQEAGQIMLPPPSDAIFPSGLVKIHNIEIEKWDEHYRIKPDAEGIMENGERLFIEFLVSHKVDERKRKVIIDNHLKCIEIDINFLALDKAELYEFLTQSNEYREWVKTLPPLQNESDKASFCYPTTRKPVYGVARDMLKRIFDENTLYLHPYKQYENHFSMFNTDVIFDLRELGYDVCDVHTKFRGFKCDLLLSKSQSEGKDISVSINVRGRRRKENFRHPKDLLIVDIVLKYGTSVDEIKNRWANAVIVGTYETKVIYTGFGEWFLKEKPLPKKMVNKKDVSLPNQL